MKFYLLERIKGCEYDENLGYLILAKDEIDARKLANDGCVDEGSIWGDPKEATCIELWCKSKVFKIILNKKKIDDYNVTINVRYYRNTK